MPDLPHALELPDVEGVQANQLAGRGGLDVARDAPLGALELPAAAVGEQADRAGAVRLQDPQPLAAGRQAGPPEDPLHGAGRHLRQALLPQVGGQPTAAPGGPRQADPDHQPFHVGGRLGRAPRPGLPAAGVQAVRAVALEALAPPVEPGPGDPRLPAGRADVAELLRAAHDTQAHSEYALVQGHRSLLPIGVPCQGLHAGKDTADDPLLSGCQVSTLLRPSTA